MPEFAPPRREAILGAVSGGNFTLSAGPGQLDANSDYRVTWRPASVISGLNLTLVSRDANASTINRDLFPGVPEIVQGATYSRMNLSSPDASTLWEQGPAGWFAATGSPSAWAQTWGNGTQAPRNGIIYFTASVTSGEVTVSDGTTTQSIATDSGSTSPTASTWYDYHFHAISGVTYTVAGTGLIILGQGKLLIKNT